MTVREWLMTPYFWIPVAASLVAVGILFFKEERGRLREKTCPTCYSTRRSARYTVRYWLSDYIYNDSPCEDAWHRR